MYSGEFLLKDCKDLDVLEVGSRDVNGGLRGIVEKQDPKRYLGIDYMSGPGVDLVWDITWDKPPWEPESFDLIICTEVLEHVQDWRKALRNMDKALKMGGWLFLTARGPGFGKHEWPHDYWRFTIGLIRYVYQGKYRIHTLVNDPQIPGFILYAQKERELECLDELEAEPIV